MFDGTVRVCLWNAEVWESCYKLIESEENIFAAKVAVLENIDTDIVCLVGTDKKIVDLLRHRPYDYIKCGQALWVWDTSRFALNKEFVTTDGDKSKLFFTALTTGKTIGVAFAQIDFNKEEKPYQKFVDESKQWLELQKTIDHIEIPAEKWGGRHCATPVELTNEKDFLKIFAKLDFDSGASIDENIKNAAKKVRDANLGKITFLTINCFHSQHFNYQRDSMGFLPEKFTLKPPSNKKCFTMSGIGRDIFRVGEKSEQLRYFTLGAGSIHTVRMA